MITFETVAEIAPDHTMTIGIPKSIQPGAHRVVVVVEEASVQPTVPKPNSPLRLIGLDLSGWPTDSNFSREGIYGDAGVFS